MKCGKSSKKNENKQQIIINPGYMDDYDKIVQSYIKYYHIRAQKCKQFYYAFTIIKIALAASIPVLQMISVVKKLSGNFRQLFLLPLWL